MQSVLRGEPAAVTMQSAWRGEPAAVPHTGAGGVLLLLLLRHGCARPALLQLLALCKTMPAVRGFTREPAAQLNPKRVHPDPRNKTI